MAISLVTVGSRGHYVYRYEGNLNSIENAAVLISYPKEAFHTPKALRVFISTNVSLSTCEILDKHVERWPVEVFSVSQKINWRLTGTRSVLPKGSGVTGR